MPRKPSEKSELRQGRREFLKSAGAGLTASAAGMLGLNGIDPANAEAGAPPRKDPIPPPPSTQGDTARADLGGRPIADHPEGGEQILAPLSARVEALVHLLEDKGVVNPALVDQFVETYNKQVGPYIGKAVVAHAWVDQKFRDALLNPAAPRYEPYRSHPQRGPLAATIYIREWLDEAARNPGFLGFQWPPANGLFLTTLGPEGEQLRVVANGWDHELKIRVHNLVSCTLCSCYPQALLGPQPVWYKSRQYRARSQSAPRGVMLEFAETNNELAAVEEYLHGIDELRVWDSNSEVRFLVLPEQPAGTEHLGEIELRGLITRDGMIGARTV